MSQAYQRRATPGPSRPAYAPPDPPRAQSDRADQFLRLALLTHTLDEGALSRMLTRAEGLRSAGGGDDDDSSLSSLEYVLTAMVELKVGPGALARTLAL